MAKPLQTDNAGFSAVVDWDLGPRRRSRRSPPRASSISTRTTTRSRRASRSGARGTLVDTEQVSQEFRFTGVAERQARLSGRPLPLQHRDATRRRATTTASTPARSSRPTRSTRRSTRRRAGRCCSVAERRARHDASRTRRRTASRCSARSNWHLTDETTLTLGLRRTGEDKTSDIDEARDVRRRLAARVDRQRDGRRDPRRRSSATCSACVPGEPLDESSYSWLVNPSYQRDGRRAAVRVGGGRREVGLRAVRRGGRLAGRTSTPSGRVNFEVGVKSLLLDRRLMLNANLYQTRVEDYQAVTSEPDRDVADGLQLRARQHSGDPRARRRARCGIRRHAEPCASTSAARTTTRSTPTGRRPRARAPWPASVTVCDNTGRQIVGAPKWTGDRRRRLRVRARAATSWAACSRTTRTARSTTSSSSCRRTASRATTRSRTSASAFTRDARRLTYEVNLVGKNVFDTHYTTSVNDFSNNAPVGYDGIGPRRYVGVGSAGAVLARDAFIGARTHCLNVHVAAHRHRRAARSCRGARRLGASRVLGRVRREPARRARRRRHEAAVDESAQLALRRRDRSETARSRPGPSSSARRTR